MKSKLLKFSFLIFILSAYVGNSSAQLLLKENFEYAVGDSLCGQPTWDWMNVPTTRNLVLIQSDALTYPDYPASGVGNKVTLTNSGEDLYRTFPRQMSGSVYTSFLVNVTGASTTGDYFFALTSNPSSKSIFHGRVYVKKDANGKVAFGVTRVASAKIGYTDFVYDMNTTYLVVLKYDIISGATNDVCSMVINPVIATGEPTTWITTTSSDVSAEDVALVGAIALRQGSTTPDIKISGIRVAANWTDLMNGSALVQGLVLSTDDGTKAGFTATTTSPSTVQSFKISGTNLTAGVVFTQIGTTKYFELSTNGTDFVNEITLTPDGGNLAETTVYIRMKSNTAAAAYTNTFYITSTGVNTTYLKASGSVTVSTGVKEQPGAVSVSVQNGIIKINGINTGEKIEVFNVGGQKVYYAFSNGNTAQLLVKSVGVNIVRVAGKNIKIVL